MALDLDGTCASGPLGTGAADDLAASLNEFRACAEALALEGLVVYSGAVIGPQTGRTWPHASGQGGFGWATLGCGWTEPSVGNENVRSKKIDVVCG